VQEFGIGREGDVLELHGGIDRDARQILSPQRAARAPVHPTLRKRLRLNPGPAFVAVERRDLAVDNPIDLARQLHKLVQPGAEQIA
jgi:hypothetical protein